MDHANRGEAALSNSEWDAAIKHYTLALESNPQAVTYYIKRSTAHQRNHQFELAHKDADLAVALATKRGKRELIAQAQLRRGIALFHLERYGDAQRAFELSKAMNEKENSLGIWMIKTEGKLKELSHIHDKGKVIIKDVPEVELPTAPAKKEVEESKKPESTAKPPQVVSTTGPIQTPKEKIRHEWFQSSDKVTITIFAKGVPKDKATIDIHERSISVSFPVTGSSDYDFSLDPLFATVDASMSTATIMSTKIEITLVKAVAGQKWSSLEGNAATDASSSSAIQAPSVTSKSPSTGPSYPTSSRSGPKNWDKIAQSYSKPLPSRKKEDGVEATEEEPQKEVDENDDEGIYVDEYEDGDPVNGFFKKLFAGADPDTRRAMMKSYQESGGTALSTNWAEVSKERVKVSPPEGMEEKKWDA